MHELAIVHGIVDAVTERCGGRRIVRVAVTIGRRSGVVPDAIRFSFDLATEGTLAEGATLEIRETEDNDLRIQEMEVAEHE